MVLHVSAVRPGVAVATNMLQGMITGAVMVAPSSQLRQR